MLARLICHSYVLLYSIWSSEAKPIVSVTILSINGVFNVEFRNIDPKRFVIM